MVITNLILKQLGGGGGVNIYADNQLIGTVSNSDKNNGTVFQWKHPKLEKDVNITLTGVQDVQDEQTTRSDYFARVGDPWGYTYGYVLRYGSLTINASGSSVNFNACFGDITTTTKYTKNESFVLGKNQNELIMDYAKSSQNTYTSKRNASGSCDNSGFTGENYCTNGSWQGKGEGRVVITDELGYPYTLYVN